MRVTDADTREDLAEAIRGSSEHDAAMSLKQQNEISIPEQTRRVARAAFPIGCACLSVADVLGCVYQDRQFAALFPRVGQPAEAPGRLALAAVLQFMEGLPDRQAADAVRARIDWKYALGLELINAGFDHTVLSELRTRLVKGGLELLLLEALLERAEALPAAETARQAANGLNARAHLNFPRKSGHNC